MRTNRTALLALTAAGLLWGMTVPLTKVALGWLDPAWLTVARFGLAAPVLAVIARRHLRAAATPAVAGWGALGFGMVLLLQNLGIERTSVSHAALILGAVPALVALVTAVSGRGTAGPVAWVGFVVALAGVGLVAGAGGGASPAGDAMVLGSAALTALFISNQGRLLAGRNAIAVTAVQMAAGAAVALPLALTSGAAPWQAGPAPLGWDAHVPSPGEAAAVFALVTLGSLLPFALYAFGQKRVSAEVAGAFVNLEPLVGAAAGGLAFGDPFGALQMAGALAVLCGIGLSLEPRIPRCAPVLRSNIR